MTNKVDKNQKAGGKKGNYKKVKQVLAAPFQTAWPDVDANLMRQIEEELKVLGPDLFKSNFPSIPWLELQKVPKAKRKEYQLNKRKEYLEQLDSEAKECLESKEKDRNEKLQHLHLGYNKIMRQLRNGKDISCVLVNKNITPPFLPESFVEVCNVKKISLVGVSSLDNFYRNTIAIALKTSASSPENVFYRLYSLIKRASPVRNFTSSSSGRYKQNEGGLVYVYAEKYYLRKSRGETFEDMDADTISPEPKIKPGKVFKPNAKPKTDKRKNDDGEFSGNNESQSNKKRKIMKDSKVLRLVKNPKKKEKVAKNPKKKEKGIKIYD